MKILQVLASQGDGGLEKHTIELCECLSQNHGHEVHLMAPKALLEKVSHPEIRKHAFEFKRSRFNPFQLLSTLRTIKKINPDVVHYQANKAAKIGSFLNRCLAIPSICTIHNLKKRLSFLKSFNRVIAVSKNVANHFPANTNYDVIYNGIYLDNDAIKMEAVLSDPVKWIAIGRLVEAKGFDLLLKAFKTVPGQLTIVGDGPQKADLIKTCHENQITDRVEFLGSRRDVQTLLKKHDICVVSSRNEGFSYVIAEALTHHTPVISTDVPVANEFFGREKLCAVNDHNALSNLMNSALNEGFNYDHEFTFAQDNFTIDSMGFKTSNLYQRLLRQDDK